MQERHRPVELHLGRCGATNRKVDRAQGVGFDFETTVQVLPEPTGLLGYEERFGLSDRPRYALAEMGCPNRYFGRPLPCSEGRLYVPAAIAFRRFSGAYR